MTPKFTGRAVVSLLIWAGLATCAMGQSYGAPGVPGYDPGAPSWPYGHAGGYVYGSVPPPPQSLPGYSSSTNPYAPVPNTYPYQLPPNAYMPNAYTYSPPGYGYGYPASAYSAPAYPSNYYPNSYPYSYPDPQRRRDTYRLLTLGQYIRLELHGPTRVRDVVPGIPELGGGTGRRR